MGILLLPRYLLASAVALTLGHAVFAQGTNCGPHHGRLPVNYVKPSLSYNSQSGYVRAAPLHKYFTLEYSLEGKYPPGMFYFWGCKGGSEFILYCYDPICDPSGQAVAEIYSGSVDANGNPNVWMFANAGVNPLWFPQNTYNGTVHSAYWTWGADNLIRPVTFNFDRSNQGIQLEGQVSGTDSSITFLDVPNGRDFYYLTWEDA